MLGLYAWGANSHGQLGLGYTCEMVCEPRRVDELPAQLCESAVAGIVGGGGHTLLLTTKGTLYGAGWNKCGQVGEGTASRCVPCFRECRGLEGQEMTSVACGWAHSVACSASGHVWVWGSNSHGQLGLPTDEVPFSSLPICLQLRDVISVAAGLRHTVVATRGGAVYSWGHGHRGQLGHVSEGATILSHPRLLDTLETKVASVSCGQNMTYGVTTEGAVLAWGDNKWGQLAHDPRNLLYFTCPLTIPSNYFGCERVSWLQAGWTHCVARTVSGGVYVWGRADYGQLGPPADEGGQPVLGRLDAGEQQDDDDDMQQLDKYRFIPSLMTVAEGLTVKQLVCGSEHTMALLCRHQHSTTERTPRQYTPRQHHHTTQHNNDAPDASSVGSLPDTTTDVPDTNRDALSSLAVVSSVEPSSVVDNVITDSGTVSSSSDSGSLQKSNHSTQGLTSNSPTSDTVIHDKVLGGKDSILSGFKELKISENDQPYTLSPIDSPRTLLMQPSNTPQAAFLTKLDNIHSTKECDQLDMVGQSENKPSAALNPKSGLASNLAGSPSLESLQSVGGTRRSRDEFPGIFSWGWNEHGNCGVSSTTNVTVPCRVTTDGKVLLVGAGSGHSFALIRQYSKVAL